jgi:hypothetical protein
VYATRVKPTVASDVTPLSYAEAITPSMQRHRIRVELADAPGTLARVAAVTASFAANIVSVDIHELDGVSVVDELVIEAPADFDFDALGESLERRAGATLLSCQQCDDELDPVTDALKQASAIIAALPEQMDDELNRAIARTCVCSHNWTCGVDDARMVPAGLMALERERAVIHRSDLQATGISSEPPSRVWLLAVPYGVGTEDRVAFVARPLSLRFSASEIARVEALVSLRDRIVRTIDKARRSPAVDLLAS